MNEAEEKRLMEQLGKLYEEDPSHVRQEWLGIPYTESELAKLCDSPSLTLVHEAKKQGAVIDSVTGE